MKGAFNFLGNSKLSQTVQKNIFISFVLKGGSVLVGLMMIPLTIDYINPAQYGIWLTMSSMVYWLNAFDIGIGNGLRNDLASNFAMGESKHLREKISTSYAILSLISIIIFALSLASTFLFDWNKLLNTYETLDSDITPVVILLIIFFCVQFVAQLINSILNARQESYKSSLILFSGQLLALILVIIAKKFVGGTLMLLVMIVSGSTAGVLIFASILLFKTELNFLAPSLTMINRTAVSAILKTGGEFFVIQICAMALIYTNNFVISQVMGPEEVTIYNIPFRLFSTLSILFAIIITPYWSAFTESYVTKNMEWIKGQIRKLRLFCLGLTIIGILILLMSNQLYYWWVGDVVKVPYALSVWMFIYTSIFIWHTLHVFFLNGIGKIRLQLVVALIGSVANVVLTKTLAQKIGVNGVVIGNTIIFALMSIIYTIQCQLLIHRKADGIWNH